MSRPTKEDFELYARLVNEVRELNGLLPMLWVVPVDDPRQMNREMQALLDEDKP